MTYDVDVIVAGAGPVGLAAAIEARMRGFSVAIVEPRRGAIDKACGEGLMPGAVTALARLGVEPAGHTVTGIRYVSGNREAVHEFRHGAGRGVRRTVLQTALFERARELDIGMVAGRVDAIWQDDAGVTAGGIRASWLLACDGLHSPIARQLALTRPTTPASRWPSGSRAHRRYGLRRHFVTEPWSTLVDVHWTEHAEIYVTPVDDRLVGVAVLGPQHTAFSSALASVPELRERLHGAEFGSQQRGAGPLRQSTVARTLGRVLLVGDASGYVDAITGEGIRVGLAQARAAVDAIAAGDPAVYERTWRIVTRDMRMLTLGLVAWAMSPARGMIVPSAERLPPLFGAVVERLAR